MRTRFLIQPDETVGQALLELLATVPPPTRVTFVSAFANRQALMRLRAPLARVNGAGGLVRIVIGIDLDGTSEEALREILSWNSDAFVVNNPSPRNTFHPKVYLIEGPASADLIVGSSNLTDGGLFTNYEASALLSFDLPADQTPYDDAQRALGRFLSPSGGCIQPLSAALISSLVHSGLVLSQRERRRLRSRESSARPRSGRATPGLFAREIIPDPPPLPPELLAELLPVVARERKSRRQAAESGRKIVVRSSVEIQPFAFYMHLPKLQGKNIPGEARIPLEARDLAETFWGWPENYRHTRSARNKQREYWNWKPLWLISAADAPVNQYTDGVRMYEYKESSDFRFYSRRLISLGADTGDIVRIVRLTGDAAEFECILARKGTPAHQEWSTYCNRPIRNSPGRFYGYA